jgi:hypothetical protein
MSDSPTLTAAWEYSDHVETLRLREPELAEELKGFTGVEHVLQWMLKRGLKKPPLDMVGQDEFNYDFLLELEPAGRWLAFSVT